MTTTRITTAPGEHIMKGHRTLKSVALAGIAGFLMTAGAQATTYLLGDVRWDSDFNADTVGLAPSTEAAGAGLPAGTLTRPIPPTSGTTIRSSLGGLTDQPVELVIPVGNDKPENLAYADFDSFIFDPPDVNYRFEWDMSIVSSPATSAGSVLVARLDGVGFGATMIQWSVGATGGADSVGVVFGEGSAATAFLPWAFGTPMHMQIDIDQDNGLFSLYKDGIPVLNEFSIPALDRVYNITFKSAHGGVGVGVGGTIAIDNFKATTLLPIPEPSTLLLALSGVVLLLGRKVRNK